MKCKRTDYSSLPVEIQAEIERGWQGYRKRGHTRAQHDRLVLDMLCALIRLLYPGLPHD